jgi:chloride channel protein, CIC family
MTKNDLSSAATAAGAARKPGAWLLQLFGEVPRRESDLADYTITRRVIFISLLATVIGFACSFVAWALLRLIGFFTNLFFYQRIGFEMVSPAGHHLGHAVLLVPILGGLIVGLMARFGSEKIRGHGMPEAIDAILLRGAKLSPRVAFFKPVSAAIAIGSGGPFGAEGPIIMTGGACGSLIAQFFHLTDAERRTLLVSGSAAGMAAVFAAPVSATLLAVELFLFEWKPRSLVPVALAAAVAGTFRRRLLGLGPIFPTAPHAAFLGGRVLIGCAVLGLLAALLAAILSRSIYRIEDAFEHLPLHWMWWPAIGGVAIGVGGWIFPRALGVGYDVIADLVQGNFTWKLVAGILIVKSAMWALSLGSGTSGGIVAPLLMEGGALGGAAFLLVPQVFPDAGSGFWPLIAMGAVLTGAIGTPFTGIIFVIELSHDLNLALPLMIGCVVSYLCSTLMLPRSILTERISRRGYHVSREYSVDPLEFVSVREAMGETAMALPADLPVQELRQTLREYPESDGKSVFLVVREDRQLVGVLTAKDIQNLQKKYAEGHPSNPPLRDMVQREPIIAYPDEPLRAVAQRMAASGLTRLPVVERREHSEGAGELVGVISLQDLLKGRVANLEAERRRERVLAMSVFLPQRAPAREPEQPAVSQD